MQKLPAYSDVQEVMDAAAQSARGIRYRVKTWGQAVNFRQRCYSFRAKARELAQQSFGMVPGYITSTPYEDLEISIEAEGGKLIKKPLEIFSHYDLVIRHRKPGGMLLDLDTGEEIDLNRSPE